MAPIREKRKSLLKGNIARIFAITSVLRARPLFAFQERTPISLHHCHSRYHNRPTTKMTLSSSSSIDPVIKLGLPSPLILGSGSFTRKLILSEMGISYHIMKRPIDEKGFGDRSGNASDLVSLLAEMKGDHLADGILKGMDGLTLPDASQKNDKSPTGWILLTADQVVTHDGDILEKPSSIEEAREYAKRYAASPPRTVGACVVTHIPSMTRVSGVDSAQINFSPSIGEGDVIGGLLEDGAPVLDCAGGLMVEHPLVKEHIESIDGTEDSVMGLSKDLVLRLLAEMSDKLDRLNE